MTSHWITSGRRIAELRKAAGLSQQDLADVIGVGRSTLGEIERATERPGLANIIALADYFKVPIDWLLCRPIPLDGPLAGEFVDDPDELAWVHFWRSLADEDRRAVLRLLRIPGIAIAE